MLAVKLKHSSLLDSVHYHSNVGGILNGTTKRGGIIGSIRPISNSAMLEPLLGADIFSVRRGSGFFDSISKWISYLVPKAKDIFNIAKPIVGQIGELTPKVFDVVGQVGNVLKTPKDQKADYGALFNNLGALVDPATKIAKDIHKGVLDSREIIKGNQTLNNISKMKQLTDLATDSAQKKASAIKEANTNKALVKASQIQSINPDLAVIGGDSVKQPVGSGLIKSIIAKNRKKLVKQSRKIRGKGFKSM